MRARVAALIAVAACNADAPPPQQQPPPPRDAPRAPAPPPLDAAPPAPDAADFALFDHLAIRTVKRAAKPYAIPLAPGELRRPSFTITREQKVSAPAPATPLAPLPPWMQTHLGNAPIVAAEEQLDGSWIARSRQILILVDRAHHPEVGFDFGDVRAAIPAAENPELFEGGDHSFTADVLQIEHAHRSGGALVVETSLGSREQHVLLGVDVATGQIAWVTPAGTGYDDFVLAGGHAIASARAGRRWLVGAYALDTGARDGSIVTQAGPYRLALAAATALVGTMPPPVDSSIVPTAPHELAATIAFDADSR